MLKFSLDMISVKIKAFVISQQTIWQTFIMKADDFFPLFGWWEGGWMYFFTLDKQNAWTEGDCNEYDEENYFKCKFNDALAFHFYMKNFLDIQKN